MSWRFPMSPAKLFTIIFILLLLFQLPLVADTPAPLKIGIIGDQTGTYNLDESYRILEKAVGKLSGMNPDLVLHVGDLVESVRGIQDYRQYRENFDRAVGIMNRLPVSWYLTAGDHDVVPPLFQPASEDHSRVEWFRQLCTTAGIPIQENLYYSFDHRGYHFISLYSVEYLHTDPRWGPIFLNRFSEEQLSWLQQDLERYKSAPGIVVFLHQPNWYAWSNWYPVHQILRRYPVAGVIAGHFHYDQDDGLIDGIRYLVIGSTGGVIKNTDVHSGGSYQYATLTLEGDSFTAVELLDVESDSLLEFTPRRSMDRIQAISCMLDNLYRDETIYRNNGQLMYPSGQGRLDTLSHIGLESLANPIDLPIQITISSLTPALHNPRWMHASPEDSREHFITLKPGERVGWSNYTSVGQWQVMNPLWMIDVPADSAGWKIPDDISLRVQVSFTDSRERWIESTVSYPVKTSNLKDSQPQNH